jgi:hypothetical protein
MSHASLALALALGLLIPSAGVAQQQDSAQVDITLQVRSTVPGLQIHFKAAFVIDDHEGLRFVEATTPFEAKGRTRGATAILQRVGEAAELEAQLVRGTGSDTLTVARASGPRLVVQYQPYPMCAVRVF